MGILSNTASGKPASFANTYSQIEQAFTLEELAYPFSNDVVLLFAWL